MQGLSTTINWAANLLAAEALEKHCKFNVEKVNDQSWFLWDGMGYAVGYWCRHRSKGCSKAPPLPCESRRKSRLGCVLQWKTSSTVAGVQRTLERPVLYYTLYKFRNRRIHWALCIHNTPGFRQIKIGPSQTFPTFQRGSYGSVLKEKMPGRSNQCRHLSWPKVWNLKLYLAGAEGLTEPSSTAKLHNLS